eukprot:COSAG02_NODE_9036_length_2353_cov_6.458740_3_plen_53_part_00
MQRESDALYDAAGLRLRQQRGIVRWYRILRAARVAQDNGVYSQSMANANAET